MQDKMESETVFVLVRGACVFSPFGQVKKEEVVSKYSLGKPISFLRDFEHMKMLQSLLTASVYIPGDEAYHFADVRKAELTWEGIEDCGRILRGFRLLGEKTTCSVFSRRTGEETEVQAEGPIEAVKATGEDRMLEMSAGDDGISEWLVSWENCFYSVREKWGSG